MKKIVYVSSLITALFVSQIALAGYGNMIQIRNESDKAYTPRVLDWSCMSNRGSWPKTIPAHSDSQNVYVETHKEPVFEDCYGSGLLLLGFTSDDGSTFFESLLVLDKSKVYPDPTTLSPAYSFVNNGILSKDWDYVSIVIK
jgi:hypothetical protein